MSETLTRQLGVKGYLLELELDLETGSAGRFCLVDGFSPFHVDKNGGLLGLTTLPPLRLGSLDLRFAEETAAMNTPGL